MNFKLWLLTEISREVAADLDQWLQANAKELPFANLFPDETTTRIAVPFQVAPEATNILAKIKQAGLTINFTTGIVSDGKRQIRLGKYLLSKKASFTDKEKNWWIKQGQAVTALQLAEQADAYAMIISRNPIDIARMSDHDGLSSCHAPDNDYFHCAIADAKGAGLIAYAVNKHELSQVDLQTAEIFQDAKRHVKGIKPLARLRLRQFVHKTDDYALAIPEERIYGDQIPGFADEVANWARKAQHLQGKRPNMKDFKRMGGSYQDTIASDLFNNFFGDDLDSGDADYGGEDEYSNLADQYDEEIDIIKREFANKFKIAYFYAEVEESEGIPYVSYNGGLHLLIPNHLLLASLPKWDDANYRQVHKAITDWADKQHIYSINEIHLEQEEDGAAVNIDLYDEGDGIGNNHTPDHFRSWLENDLTDFDGKKDELEASLYRLFVDLGLARANQVYQLSQDWDNNQRFQHFTWQGEEPEVHLALQQPIHVGPVVPFIGYYSNDKNTYYQGFVPRFQQTLSKELVAWAAHVQARAQPYLFPDPEFHLDQTGSLRIQPELAFSQRPQGTILALTLVFPALANDHDVQETLLFAKFLDSRYDRFVDLTRKIFLQLLDKLPAKG